jgi:hypothetical protein
MRWTKIDLTCICFKKNKLTYYWFKSSPSICTSWIDHMDFIYFWPNKIHVNPTGVVSSLSPPRCRLSFGRCCHAVTPCHASFPLSQDELAVSTSSSGNALSRRLPSQVKTEALNLHHRRRLPSSDCPTPILHCYKKIISILATLPATQPCLHFASSLSRAPHHRSATRWPYFASRITYRHVNLHKKYFKMPQHCAGL